MMDIITSFKQNCLNHLRESSDRIEQCMSHYDKHSLWQRPNPASNSMGNLLLHLCGNITQYILCGLDGRTDERCRQQEFDTTQGPAPDVLLRQLQAVIDDAMGVIARLPDEEWLRRRPVQCFEMDGIAIVIHVVEHLSYHTGQISFYTKQLKGVDLGYYAGQNLDAKGGV
jgi:uncharacterized damage-inducible protein DinB